MVLRHTGPGKIEVDERYTSPGIAKALLYNFDIDGDTIKTEHRNYITTHIQPLLRDNRGRCWMQGKASRTGSNAHNLALSRRRVDHAALVLARNGIQRSQLQTNAVGEDLSFGARAEDERDRAVALIVLPYAPTPTPPPPQVPRRPPTTTQFKIRMLMNLSASAGASGEFSVFQIWDVRNAKCSFYTYTAAGISAGILDGMWLSATTEGPWNDMPVSAPIAANQFHGPARFTTGGGAWWSYNVVNFMGLPGGVVTIPNPFRMDTGFTIGIGGGSSVGQMTLQRVGTPDGLLPFSG